MSGVDGYNALPSDTEKEARDKEATGEALRSVVPDWVRTGKMVKGLKLDSGNSLAIQHGLKRNPEGWILVAPRVAQGSGSNYCIVETMRDSAKLALSNTGTVGLTYFDLWVW